MPPALIIIRCSRERCMARIRQRYEANPGYYDPPEVYMTEPKNISIWEYLAKLDHPTIRFVDASRPHNEVYEEVREYVSSQLKDNAA